MVKLVETMLDPSAGSELALRNSKGQALHKQLPTAKTPHEREFGVLGSMQFPHKIQDGR